MLSIIIYIFVYLIISIEKAHLKFFTLLYLEVKSKASNIAGRGEFGKCPLIVPNLPIPRLNQGRAG
jgi:hypothetical protein